MHGAWCVRAFSNVACGWPYPNFQLLEGLQQAQHTCTSTVLGISSPEQIQAVLTVHVLCDLGACPSYIYIRIYRMRLLLSSFNI